jgi:hypothetical protein
MAAYQKRWRPQDAKGAWSRRQKKEEVRIITTPLEIKHTLSNQYEMSSKIFNCANSVNFIHYLKSMCLGFETEKPIMEPNISQNFATPDHGLRRSFPNKKPFQDCHPGRAPQPLTNQRRLSAMQTITSEKDQINPAPVVFISAYRIALVRDRELPFEQSTLSNSFQARAVVRSLIDSFGQSDREQLGVIA